MEVYGDLHIHIGRTANGEPVKITGSKQLTLENIFTVARKEKGLNLVGLVDAACKGVLSDLQKLLASKQLLPIDGGGYRWGDLTVFLGSEVEIAHGGSGKTAHFLAFFPSWEKTKGYAQGLEAWLTNPFLSTQKLKTDADSWLEMVLENDGLAFAAHAFTPHKGVYGSCVSRLGEMFACPQKITGLELGLSANTKMAWGISDTHRYPYLSNSDAHSLGTIGREFTVYKLPSLNFREWEKALYRIGGIKATHGLEPSLGKYFRSFCPQCHWAPQKQQPFAACPRCQNKVILGVWDRIQMISDNEGDQPKRPPYKAHVPLTMLPGVGPKTYGRLIENLGPEIEILYNAPLAAITRVAGDSISQAIQAMREGRLAFLAGGGGKYGKVAKDW